MNATQQVTLTTLIAAGLLLFARFTKVPPAGAFDDAAPWAMGWLIIFITLQVMADIPATADLAVAFGYLLLIGALLAYGVPAFQHIGSLIPASDSGSQSGGKKHA